MFDKLFGSRAAVQHHLSSPLLQERLEYLQHGANQAEAIAHCEPESTKPAKHWSEDKGLMPFLRSL